MKGPNHPWSVRLCLLLGLLLLTELGAAQQPIQSPVPLIPRHVRLSVQLVQRSDLIGSSVELRPGGVQVGGGWQIRRSQATVFLLIADGGEGHITVGESVPHVQWLYQYSLGQGYLTLGTVFRTVSTGFRVIPTILPGERVRLQLTPQISYFTDREQGEIAFVEASLDVVVPNGHSVVVASDQRQADSVLFQILGSARQRGLTELVLMVTPQIQ